MQDGLKNVCVGAAWEVRRPVDIGQFRWRNGNSNLFAEETTIASYRDFLKGLLWLVTRGDCMTRHK